MDLTKDDAVLRADPPPPAEQAEPAPALTEDLALSALKSPDLSADDVEQIGKNAALMKSRKVKLAVAAHPRAPRRLTLRLVRELYTFDLMRFSLLPVVPADLKRVAEQQLVARLASITLGERLSMARRSSSLVAAALLLDKEAPVWQAALENPRLTEAAVVRALQHMNASAAFVEAACRHAKWSLRYEIRLALLRNPHTPLARAIEFARRLPPAQLRDILHTSHLPEKVKAYLRKDLEARRASN
ncbi:MAG: hypothetical protein ACLQBK_13810 [Candidatus Sulfotelmatobacter sp.]